MDNKTYQELGELFKKISERIENNSDSLQYCKICNNMGLEGWLKVETIRALENKVKKVCGKGADLILDVNNEEIKVELKGMSNFDISYIKKGFKQAEVVLFLADGNKKKFLKLGRGINSRYNFFTDGKNEWVISMMIK